LRRSSDGYVKRTKWPLPRRAASACPTLGAPTAAPAPAARGDPGSRPAPVRRTHQAEELTVSHATAHDTPCRHSVARYHTPSQHTQSHGVVRQHKSKHTPSQHTRSQHYLNKVQTGGRAGSKCTAVNCKWLQNRPGRSPWPPEPPAVGPLRATPPREHRRPRRRWRWR